MAIIKEEDFEKPFLLDILKVTSDNTNQYDLPFYFMGQVLKTNFEVETPQVIQPIGNANGYQHLWAEGNGTANDGNTKLSWMNNGKFYTLTSETNIDDELQFVRIGANDPEFNLRRDAGLLIRRKNSKNTTFASIIEAHGNYSPVSEFAVNSNSSISKLSIAYDDDEFTAISIQDINGASRMLILSNLDAKETNGHNLKINDKDYEWSGPYYFK